MAISWSPSLVVDGWSADVLFVVLVEVLVFFAESLLVLVFFGDLVSLGMVGMVDWLVDMELVGVVVVDMLLLEVQVVEMDLVEVVLVEDMLMVVVLVEDLFVVMVLVDDGLDLMLVVVEVLDSVAGLDDMAVLVVLTNVGRSIRLGVGTPSLEVFSGPVGVDWSWVPSPSVLNWGFPTVTVRFGSMRYSISGSWGSVARGGWDSEVSIGVSNISWSFGNGDR
jgi:hypothetical protein